MNAALMHRLRQSVSLCALGFAVSLPAATDARSEYDELLALSRKQLPAQLRADEDAKVAWFIARFVELHDRGVAFLSEHARHPLRWDVLVLLRYGREHVVRTSRSGFKQVFPEPRSRGIWEADYYPRLQSLLVAEDASRASRREALRLLLEHSMRRAASYPDELVSIVPRVTKWLDQFEQEFPRSLELVNLYRDYATMLDYVDPAQCAEFLRELERRYARAERIDQLVKEFVVGRRRALEAQFRPPEELWARLRELDPVRGDPARYKGKVVVLALAPITYVRVTETLEDLHAEHNRAGLEIIHIVPFNRAIGQPPKADQRKNAEAIAAKNQWPWPVLWNPDGHLEDIAGKWGFNTVPAWMIIRRDGRLVPEWDTNFSVTIPRELAKTHSSQP